MTANTITQKYQLTEQQREHFRLFGFVVLKNWLSREETARLAGEVETAIQTGYSRLLKYGERRLMSGYYMPIMAANCPFSLALVADDGRFQQAVEKLLTVKVLPDYAEGILYTGQAPWHYDDGIGVEGVKFATYFDSLKAHTGALRLLPGSHQPSRKAELEAYRNNTRFGDLEEAHNFTRHIAAFPAFVAETDPGDVIAFDVHTWHASLGGTKRLSWTIQYLKNPTTISEKAAYTAWMRGSCDQSERNYDHTSYPLFRDWLKNQDANPNRAVTIARMRELGVFELEGALS